LDPVGRRQPHSDIAPAGSGSTQDRDSHRGFVTIPAMLLSEALRRLAPHRDAIHSRGVRALWIFGSVARGDARADSDVDVLVEFSRPVGFLEFFALRDDLAKVLGAPVDLVSRKGLKPALRERIEREAVVAA
jgi:predicted nucleotidyltransferase